MIYNIRAPRTAPAAITIMELPAMVESAPSVSATSDAAAALAVLAALVLADASEEPVLDAEVWESVGPTGAVDCPSIWL